LSKTVVGGGQKRGITVSEVECIPLVFAAFLSDLLGDRTHFYQTSFDANAILHWGVC